MDSSNSHIPPIMMWSPAQSSGDENEALEVLEVDTCIEENGESHHTGRFELMSQHRSGDKPAVLVVRRGQAFRLKLHCNREYDGEQDEISFMLAVDPMQNERISHGNGTVEYLALSPADDGDKENEAGWRINVEAVEDNILTVSVRSPATASVSRWNITIDTRLAGTDKTTSFRLPQAFYLLFNPWCEKDAVFIDDDDLRQEYVLSDTTLIWRGSDRSFHPTIWHLGQYEEDILDCCLSIVQNAGRVSATYRGNPIRVARALSAAINNLNNNGALIGNWGTDFTDGAKPTSWVGSVKILQQYYRTGNPVGYGQCWVFAGVLATVARTLGIPCRVVSNFNSAHDSEASLTIDHYLGENDKLLRDFSTDSTWNFHVWNELWMHRFDFGESSELYDGWQVVDATPQELSDGMYKLGPAPVQAVKRGEINVLYDCDFVFAEVNADEVFWRYRGPGQAIKLIRKDSAKIGKFISTKAVGEWNREDITDSYKFEEKSCDERITMMKALKQVYCPFARFLKNVDFDDISFKIDIRNDVKFGEPFDINLTVENKSEEATHVVEGVINVDTNTYTGTERTSLKSVPFSMTVEPNSSSTTQVEVLFEEYYRSSLDQAYFKITCTATVEGTNYEHFSEDNYRVRKPDIHIALDNEPCADAPLYVTATLQNPMPIPITNGSFRFEFSGAGSAIEIPIDSVEAGESAHVNFRIIPRLEGNAQIAARFNSTELNDVDGFIDFEVKTYNEINAGRSLQDTLVFS